MRPFRAFLGLLLLVAVLFSGCVNPLSGGDAGEGVTAMNLLKTAEELSPMGHDGALLAVFTLETRDGSAFLERSPPAWLMPFLNVSDENIGDGRALAWGFYFGKKGMMMEAGGDGHAHGSGEDTLIVVSAKRQELFRGTVPADFPIGPDGSLADNWTIDSDAAAATAGDADIKAVLGTEGAYSFASLAVRIGSPAAWMFEAGVANAQTGATSAVDARDGLKINLGNRDPFAPVKTEAGEVTGTATTSGSSTEFTIELASHRQVEFFLEIAGDTGGGMTPTGAQVDFVAKGPGGQVFPFHWDGGGGTQQAWHQFDAPNPGVWTLEAKIVNDAAGQSTSQAFTVHWCALGATRC